MKSQLLALVQSGRVKTGFDFLVTGLLNCKPPSENKIINKSAGLKGATLIGIFFFSPRLAWESLVSRPRYRFRFMMSSAGRGETKNKEKSLVIQPSGGRRTGGGTDKKRGVGSPRQTRRVRRGCFSYLSDRSSVSNRCGAVFFVLKPLRKKTILYETSKKINLRSGGGGGVFSSGGGTVYPSVRKKHKKRFLFLFSPRKIFFPEDQNSGGAMDCLAACRVVLRLRCCFAGRLCFLFV